jgi:hypothetical protein
MKPKLIGVLFLLPGLVFSQVSTPIPKAKSQMKKKIEAAKIPGGQNELAKAPDQSYYNQLNDFLFPKEKKNKLSSTEQILGGIATAASAACAGIAAAQWLDAKAKDDKAKETATKNTNK